MNAAMLLLNVNAASQPNAKELIASFLPIILIFVIIYFLLIMPEQKRQKTQAKKHDEMIASLKKNDEVVTIGGMHGSVVNVKDTTIVLKVDENVKIEVEKQAIARLATKEH